MPFGWRALLSTGRKYMQICLIHPDKASLLQEKTNNGHLMAPLLVKNGRGAMVVMWNTHLTDPLNCPIACKKRGRSHQQLSGD